MRRSVVGGAVALGVLAAGLTFVPAATARGAAPAAGEAQGTLAVCWVGGPDPGDVSIVGPSSQRGPLAYNECRTWPARVGLYSIEFPLRQECRQGIPGVSETHVTRPGMNRFDYRPTSSRVRTHVAAGERTEVRYQIVAGCVRR